jgi:putative ABC transport system permease protein
MNLRESFTQALDNLATRKLRALLTMLGMIFGVGAVIAMLSIGAGAEAQALDAIRQMGLRNIVIEGKEFERVELLRVRERTLGLSRRDVAALVDVVPHVVGAAGTRTIKAYQVLSDRASADARVVAVDAAYFDMKPLRLVDGAYFDAADEQGHAQACVLGAAAKQQLFGHERAVGQPVKVNNLWFTVVGVIADQNIDTAAFEGVTLQNVNNDVYIPLSTALKKIEIAPLESMLDGIVIEIADERHAAAAAVVVSRLLERLHKGAADYRLVVPQELLRQSQETQRIFTIVMGCIAGISLLVGGIGIMNIMLANVLERTREIGVRRAIGARRTDVGLQFLIEAVAISALGGTLGILLGVGIAQLVVHLAGWSTIVTAWSVALSFGVATGVGILFGSYPAVQASRLSPIEALRYE